MLKKSPKAVELFCLIGLMPGGVTQDDLKELWNREKQDWFGFIQELINAQLVQKKSYPHINKQSTEKIVKYNLLPFMNYYSFLINEDLDSQHLKICKYFKKLMLNIYNKIDVEKERVLE